MCLSIVQITRRMKGVEIDLVKIKSWLGKTDMYLIDLLQKGYFDNRLKILDAGCGSGRNIWLLAGLGHEIEACDLEIEIIENITNQVIEKGLNSDSIQCRVGVIGNLPYSDARFDFVICNAVLHFAKDEIHFFKMISDLRRVLKPNGILFVRLVTSHTMGLNGQFMNQKMELGDGSTRFVVDANWLKTKVLVDLRLELKEDFKTVNIDDKRTMTTLILEAK